MMLYQQGLQAWHYNNDVGNKEEEKMMMMM